MNKQNMYSAILLVNCPDREGLVATVTEFVSKNKGNIIYLAQHVDFEDKSFFMRVEWELNNFLIPRAKIGEYFQTLIAEKLQMQWQLYFSDEKPKMALFVSKLSHCLYDILARCQSGEWAVEVPLIISNHSDLAQVAKEFHIPYYCFPITQMNKLNQEKQQLALLKECQIDFLVLGRYMQILSDDFVSHYENKIINIHHSFLPAFPGAKPYHSAYERGVKIIGATSHYVTAELDLGPIIEQDTVAVTHRDAIDDLVRKGRDLEKVVLARAIWDQIQHKILVYKNRTVVFD